MDTFTGLFSQFGEALKSVLPLSPFSGFFKHWAAGGIPVVRTGLGWLNWFFPVGHCLTLFSIWLVAVALYYVYSIVLRWVKAIG